MRVIIRDDPDAVAVWVATYIKRRILDFKPTPQRPFVLGLPTGSSPLKTYQKLVEFYKAKQLSFANVVTFNMDEYVGLPREHAQSYHSYMWNNFFKYIDIKPENAHILNGNAADLEKECEDYEALIRAAGGIELFLGGIGADGHIAFNEPGSSLASLTRIKTLAYETVHDNARFFGSMDEVPKMALTVGVGTIMAAREVVLIVTGQHKAHALARGVEEGINHMYTLSALQMHQRACIVCDEAATSELRVRTVKYFKGLEKVHSELLGDHDQLKGHAHAHSLQDEEKQTNGVTLTNKVDGIPENVKAAAASNKRKSPATVAEAAPAESSNPKRGRRSNPPMRRLTST